jgi:hypothetical protein
VSQEEVGKLANGIAVIEAQVPGSKKLQCEVDQVSASSLGKMEKLRSQSVRKMLASRQRHTTTA